MKAEFCASPSEVVSLVTNFLRDYNPPVLPTRYHLANLSTERNPDVLDAIDLVVTGSLESMSSGTIDPRQEYFYQLARDDNPLNQLPILGGIYIEPIEFEATDLAWVRIRTAPIRRLAQSFEEVRRLFADLDHVLTVAFGPGSLETAEEAEDLPVLPAPPQFHLYATIADVEAQVGAFLATKAQWQTTMAGVVFGRLCWLLAAETLAARASAESRGDDPETIESSGAIVAQVARSRVPASLVAKAVTTLAGDDAAIGTGDRVAGVTVGWLHLSRLRIHEPPALTWVRITPSLLVRFPDAKALLGELQAWLGDKYGNPPVPGSAIGEASTSETARQPDGLEQEVKDSAALAPSSDGPTTGQAQAATVFALDPSLSDPYLRESDVKLLEAWQYFAKERGAHPNRYPSPQELADKAAISVHQAKKSLARLRELKRIPHSVRSRRAAVRKATLRSAPQ